MALFSIRRQDSNNTNCLDLAECKTVEEITDVLSLKAKAYPPLAYTLQAQIQVIKYISSKELIGSTFDLLFSFVKKSLEDANTECSVIIKEQTALLLNNFIVFMDAKLRWEMKKNRKEFENILRYASDDLVKNILITLGYNSDYVLNTTVRENLSKIIFYACIGDSGLFSNFNIFKFKKDYIREKKQSF